MAQQEGTCLEEFIATTIEENSELTHDQIINLLNYED